MPLLYAMLEIALRFSFWGCCRAKKRGSMTVSMVQGGGVGKQWRRRQFSTLL